MQRAGDAQRYVVGERRRVADPFQDAPAGGVILVECGGDRFAEAGGEFGAHPAAMAGLLGESLFDAGSNRAHLEFLF